MKFLSDRYAAICLRIILGLTLLVSVSDRLGLQVISNLGPFQWGSFEQYLANLGNLFTVLPKWSTQVLGWGLTAVEMVCGFLLLVGLKASSAARIVALVYLTYAIATILSFSFKSALDHYLFVVAFAALLMSGKSDS